MTPRVRLDSSTRLKFVNEVEKHSGQKIPGCYQCGKCTAGCPVTFKMDYSPNQIMRMIQLGMRSKVLESKTPWLCASCYTCASRCPCGVSLANIMDSLKQMAQKEGINSKSSTAPVFYKIFLNILKKYGRMHELELILLYNFSTRQYFKEFMKGPKMLFKNKLKFFPTKVKNGKLKKIFDKINKV